VVPASNNLLKTLGLLILGANNKLRIHGALTLGALTVKSQARSHGTKTLGANLKLMLKSTLGLRTHGEAILMLAQGHKSHKALVRIPRQQKLRMSMITQRSTLMVVIIPLFHMLTRLRLMIITMSNITITPMLTLTVTRRLPSTAQLPTKTKTAPTCPTLCTSTPLNTRLRVLTASSR